MATTLSNSGSQSDASNRAYLLLKYTYGLVPIVAGLDKFTNLLTDWAHYLSPALAAKLPFSAATFMMIVGVIEIVAGILVLSPLTKYAAYVVAAWLTLIAINLVMLGQYDVAVRDLVMAIGALALGELAKDRA